MSDFVKPLDERDHELIALLAAGHTVTTAAAALGVNQRTAYRRLRRPAFRAALTEARAERWRPVADELRDGALRAARRLIHLAENAAHESTQVRAAVAVVELATRLRVIVDDAPQLAALEARVEDIAGTDPHDDDEPSQGD